MADKAAELSVWEVLLVLAYSMKKKIVQQYKRKNTNLQVFLFALEKY